MSMHSLIFHSFSLILVISSISMHLERPQTLSGIDVFYQNFRNSSETFVSEGKKSRNQPEQRIRDGLPSGNPGILGNPPK